MNLLRNKHFHFAMVSIPTGFLLFILLFVANTVSTVVISNKIVSVIVKAITEEFFKIVFYLLASIYLYKSKEKNKWKILNRILFGIFVFGFIENSIYFFSYPAEDVFLRLIYSYPIHIVTALLYFIAFVLLWYYIPAFFIIGSSYHSLYNLNSYLNVNSISTIVMGIINLICIAVLIMVLKELNIRRTLNVK